MEREIIERRTETAKVFDIGNNKKRHYCYGSPTHYKKDGKFEDIKIELVDQGDKFLVEENKVTVGFRKDKKLYKYLGMRYDYDHQFETTFIKIKLDGKEKISGESFEVSNKKIFNVMNHQISNGTEIISKVSRVGVKNYVKVNERINDFEIVEEIHLKGLICSNEKVGGKYLSDERGRFNFVDENKDLKFWIVKPKIDYENGEINDGLDHILEEENGRLFYTKKLTIEGKADLLINAVYPILIDADTFYSTTKDGWIGSAVFATWAGARDAAAGQSVFDSEESNQQTTTSNYVFDKADQYTIRRGFFYFDTSSLADDATVSSAVMGLYGITHAESEMAAMKGTQAATLTINDYNNFTGSSYGESVSYAVSQYNDITFNAQGKSDINLTGETLICTRDGPKDMDNVAPTGTNRNGCYFAEEVEAFEARPRLVIEVETGTEYDETYTEAFALVHTGSPIKDITRDLSDALSLTDGDVRNLTRILSEAFNTSDTYARVWSLARVHSETTNLSDSIETIKQILKTFSEAYSLEDTDSRVWDSVKTLTEAFSLSDGDAANITRILSESFSMSDSILKDFSRELNEALNISDVVEAIITYVKELTETISLSDTYARVWDATPELSESYNLSDTYSKVWTILRTYSEAISMSDADGISFSRSLVENFNLSDAFSKIIDLVRTYSETTNLSDNLLKDISREFSQSFSLSDNLAKLLTFNRTFSEAYSLTDIFSKSWSTTRMYSEALNLTDVGTKEISLAALTESLSLDDGTMPFSFIKLLTESFSITDFFVNIVFDTIRMESARTDIQAIIQEDGIQATLIRQTETTDTTGAVTDVSEQEYTIYMSIQDILREDRQIHDMSLAFPGAAKVFLFHEYPDSITGNGVVSVKVGDMIKDDEETYWRVETIKGEREMEGSEIFKSAIIKKVDLDQ